MNTAGCAADLLPIYKNDVDDGQLCVFIVSGVNRHFHMICIRDKFSQNIGRQVSSSVIWDHLGTMYDMQALVGTRLSTDTHTHAPFLLPS